MLPDAREKLQEGGICREQFTQKRDVTEHLSPPMREEKSLNCGICKKKFTRKNYPVHLLAHIGGKSHECQTCKRKFMQKSLLEEHLLTHSNQNFEKDEMCEELSELSGQKEMMPNECSVCRKKFSCKSSVTRHMLVHTREMEGKSGMFVKNLAQVKQLPNHAAGSSHVCGICGKNFASRRSVKRHLLIHTRDGAKGLMHSKILTERNEVSKPLYIYTAEGSYICGICGKEFSSRRNVKRHIPIHAKQKAMAEMHSKILAEVYQTENLPPIHPAQNSHICGICGKKFSSRRNVTRHMRIHTRRKSQQGKIQIMSVAEKEQIGKQPTYMGKNSDMCGLCGKKFSCKHNVTRHLKRTHWKAHGEVHSKEPDSNDILKLLPTNTKKNPLVCEICGKKFTSRRNVKRHLVVHVKENIHKGEMHSKNPGESAKLMMSAQTKKNPRMCGICNKIFVNVGNVRRHMIIHTGQKDYMCGVCGKKFSLKSSVTRHMLLHKGKEGHKGEICIKQTTERDQVIQANESGSNSHVCEVCGKTFGNRRNVRRHLRIHAKQKVHESEVHPKNQIEKSQTPKLLSTYITENSHVCQICKKRFSNLKNVRRHMITHTGQIQLMCRICGKKCSRKSSLTRHMLIHKGKIHTQQSTERNQVVLHQAPQSGNNSHVCGICGKAFTSRRNVKRHLLIHTKKTAHKQVARNLSTHSEEKSNKSGICNEIFSQKSGATCNMFTETGDELTSVEWKLLNLDVRVVLEDIFRHVNKTAHN